MKGLLTQWYPVSDTLGPPEGALENGPLNLATVERSFLNWKIDLVPPGVDVAPAPPGVLATNPWIFARAVDAATVKTLPRQRPERMGPTESEKFIFYRGLGTFALPVTVEASAGGKVLVKNSCKLALPFAFALSMTGDRGRMLPLGEIAGGAQKAADMSAVAERPAEAVVSDLKSAVMDALVARGLYRDEAEAMVKTWSRAWFSSGGTRILYAVPRPQVDGLLPLEIKPAPDELVRVLVGRIEYLTPETESAVEGALRQRTSVDPPARDAAMAELVRFDRFLEPHLRRIVAKTTDAAVKKSGEELLATLKN